MYMHIRYSEYSTYSACIGFPHYSALHLVLFCYSALANCIFYFAQEHYVVEMVFECLHLCYRHCCALPDGLAQQVSISSWLKACWV